jgi:hypothetical protein
MAVGRRFQLGGSFRPLSPTEGKFQLKGNGFLAMAGGAIFVAARTKIDQDGAFQAFATPSTRTAVFSLGRMITITDNASLQNPCPSR